MGTGGADREEIVTAPHEKHGFLPTYPASMRPSERRSTGNALRRNRDRPN